MRLFDLVRSFMKGRRQSDPLVDAPRPGEPIEFDEEEKRAIRHEWPSGLDDLTFKSEAAETLDATFTGGALLKVAGRRLQEADYRGAASSCVKAVGVTRGAPEAWLLLAEIHAAAGDLSRSGQLLNQALDGAAKLGISLTEQPPYDSRVVALRKQIRSSR